PAQQREFREDGKGGLTHPPAYFSLNGNKGYLFYRGQPAFCRGCLQHGHEVSGCRDLNCKNCLGQGHLAKDCKNPRRCKSCGGEGHLAHSCPRRELCRKCGKLGHLAEVCQEIFCGKCREVGHTFEDVLCRSSRRTESGNSDGLWVPRCGADHTTTERTEWPF
uniref:CCHC-type domain-containing protein n=1 Tax=Pygocentrus nattereri TaxID=42514 RepID=A0AAR2KTE4_PYGNA